ncbi:MAG: hypothetical protein ACYS8W_12020 [Planctomycetota bacterium]|jgi:hypothetical protein
MIQFRNIMKSILIGAEYREDEEVAVGPPSDFMGMGGGSADFDIQREGAAVLDFEIPSASATTETIPAPVTLEPAMDAGLIPAAEAEYAAPAQFEPEIGSRVAEPPVPVTPPAARKPFVEEEPAPPPPPPPMDHPDEYDSQAPTSLISLAETMSGEAVIGEREIPPDMEPAPEYDIDATDAKAFEDLLTLKEDDDTGEFELAGDFSDLLVGTETAVEAPQAPQAPQVPQIPKAPQAAETPALPVDDLGVPEPFHRRDETTEYGPEELARLAAAAEAAAKRPPSEPRLTPSMTAEAPPAAELDDAEKELAAEFGLLLDDMGGVPEEPAKAAVAEMQPGMDTAPAPVEEAELVDEFADMLDSVQSSVTEMPTERIEDIPIMPEAPLTGGAPVQEQVTQAEVQKLLDGTFEEEVPLEIKAPPVPDAGTVPGLLEEAPQRPPVQEIQEIPAKPEPTAGARDVEAEDDEEVIPDSVEGVDSSELNELMGIIGEDWDDDADIDE